MSPYHETWYTSEQRERFPSKFSNDYCREICRKYLLGWTYGEIRAWLEEDEGINCTYQAVWKVPRPWLIKRS